MTEETKEAKVPAGMTIKKPNPEQNQQPKGLPTKEFDIDPSLPIIQYPHYTNNAKDELACLLVRPDGMASMERKIPKDTNHPLYTDISIQFTEEEILTNTNREVQLQKANNKAMEEAKQAKEREEKRAKLWEVKSEFMEMEAVKNSTEKSLKRNLRKATSWFEALAYGCAILIKEDSKSD